jgi:hypothetical protein
MDLCNNAVPTDYKDLTIVGFKLPGRDIEKMPENDNMTNDFAPALYYNLSNEEKLQLPSYKEYVSGFSLSETQGVKKGQLTEKTRDEVTYCIKKKGAKQPDMLTVVNTNLGTIAGTAVPDAATTPRSKAPTEEAPKRDLRSVTPKMNMRPATPSSAAPKMIINEGSRKIVAVPVDRKTGKRRDNRKDNRKDKWKIKSKLLDKTQEQQEEQQIIEPHYPQRAYRITEYTETQNTEPQEYPTIYEGDQIQVYEPIHEVVLTLKQEDPIEIPQEIKDGVGLVVGALQNGIGQVTGALQNGVGQVVGALQSGVGQVIGALQNNGGSVLPDNGSGALPDNGSGVPQDNGGDVLQDNDGGVLPIHMEGIKPSEGRKPLFALKTRAAFDRYIKLLDSIEANN